MDLKQLESWTHVNFMKFHKSKCKVLHLGQGNPKCKLGVEWIESNPEENYLGVLIHENLDTSQQRMLALQRDKHVLGCIKRSAARRLREGFLPSTLLW